MIARRRALLAPLALLLVAAACVIDVRATELLVETPDGVSAGCGATIWPHPDGALMVVHRAPCAIFRDGFEVAAP